MLQRTTVTSRQARSSSRSPPTRNMPLPKESRPPCSRRNDSRSPIRRNAIPRFRGAVSGRRSRVFSRSVRTHADERDGVHAPPGLDLGGVGAALDTRAIGLGCRTYGWGLWWCLGPKLAAPRFGVQVGGISAGAGRRPCCDPSGAVATSADTDRMGQYWRGDCRWGIPANGSHAYSFSAQRAGLAAGDAPTRRSLLVWFASAVDVRLRR